MGSNANLWVLDFLLEADGLDDTLIKHFHDVNASQFEELPSNTQARLMLRVLRDAPAQPTGIAEAALGALNMLKNLADQLTPTYVPQEKVEALKPSAQLFTEVKTELVLKSMREGNQGEHPKVILDTFFVPPEQGGVLDPLEVERRNEISEGLKGPEEAQQLLAKYPVDQLNHTLLSFVADARAALGPNLLKLVEKDIKEGRYDPYHQFQSPALAAGAGQQGQDGKGKAARAAATKRKRSKGTTTTEEDAAGMLANMSQSTAVLAAVGGQDPLPDAALQAAQAAGKMPGQEGVETGDGTPNPALQAPMAGTPVSPQDQARGKAPGQPARRRNGRWNEDETNFLIRMVREKGKGKWKRILEEGGPVFQNRSQVDLKDKWRNLERQGVVGPQDLPPQPMPQLAGQVQIGMPQHVQPQFGPDGQIMSHTLLGPDGTPLTQEQAQHYAQIAAHYAQLAAAGQQQLPPELLHQQMQMAPLQQIAPQQLGHPQLLQAAADQGHQAAPHAGDEAMQDASTQQAAAPAQQAPQESEAPVKDEHVEQAPHVHEQAHH